MDRFATAQSPSTKPFLSDIKTLRERARRHMPAGLTSRSASEYATGSDLAAMIRENLIAERIAVDHYRELVRFLGDDDPATRVMIEAILSAEEEHASDMLDLLVIHGGLKR